MPEVNNSDETRATYAAYGEFMCAFSQVEGDLHGLFRELSGMNEAAAREIFGGKPNPQLKHYIRVMLNCSDDPNVTEVVKKRIERALYQIDEINNLRRIPHIPTLAKGDKLISFNEQIAKKTEEITRLSHHIQDLWDATNDLYMISWQLSLTLHQIVSPSDEILLAMLRLPAVQKDLNYAWQYKHVSQLPPANQTRDPRSNPK